METDIDISDILKSFNSSKNLKKRDLSELEKESDKGSDNDDQEDEQNIKSAWTFILSRYIEPFQLLVLLSSQYKNLIV